MNKRTLSVCGAAMFLSLLVSSAFGYEKEIEQLSEQMAAKIADKGKKTVAVVDFTDLEGNVTQLDQFIAEEFSVALAGASKGFRVIDRTRLKSIIKENKLAETGLIDPTIARKLGMIAGADALVTGTLTPFGDTVHLTVKVLDSETADVIDSAKGNLDRTAEINELSDKELYDDIFIDNFNKGRQLNWKDVKGDWVIENGQYTVGDIKKEEFYISIIKEKKWNNFIFNTDISPGYISRSLYSANICPRVVTINEFICFGVDGVKNKFDQAYWYIAKKDGGKEFLNKIDIDTKSGESIQVRIEADEGVYTSYINGNKISQLYDGGYINSGEAGLAQRYEVWDYDKIKIKFDNVSIIPVYKKDHELYR